MAKQKKAQSKEDAQPVKEAAKSNAPNKAKPIEKVVSSKRISDPKKVIDRSSFAIAEAPLLKDFGKKKKGEIYKGHPNMIDMLREKGIVK